MVPCQLGSATPKPPHTPVLQHPRQPWGHDSSPRVLGRNVSAGQGQVKGHP